MAHVQFTQPLQAHPHPHSSESTQPFSHNQHHASSPAPQQSPPSSIRYSQTHSIFQSNMAQYRAPAWAKSYSPHCRTSSDDQISPCHSPILAPAEAHTPPVDAPTLSLDTASTPSPHSSDESLQDMTPKQAHYHTRHRSEDIPRNQSHEQYQREVHSQSLSSYLDPSSAAAQRPDREPHFTPNFHSRHLTDEKSPDRRNSDSDPAAKFLPGYWWMTLDAAEQDGIVGTAREAVSRCRFGNSRVIPLMTGHEEIVDEDPDTTRYTRLGPWSAMPLSLISAVGTLIMVLRGAELASPYAPSAGVRFDGLYKILQYGSKTDPVSGLQCCGITLRRVPGQIPTDNLKDIPRPSQVEDWLLYEQLEAMSDSSGRSRGDLMQELSRESSRRPSAASTADSDNSGGGASTSSADSVPTPLVAAPPVVPPPPAAPVPAPPVMHVYTPLTRSFASMQQAVTGPMKELPPRLHDVIIEEPLAEALEEMQLSDRRCSSTTTSPSYTLSP